MSKRWGNSVQGAWGTGGIGHGAYQQLGAQGVWGYRGMGYMGNRGTGGMGYKGYGPHRQWVTWAMGYRGMGKWAMGPMGDLHPKCQKDVKLSKRC